MTDTIWNLPAVEVCSLQDVQEKRPAAVITGKRSWLAVEHLIKLPIVVQAEPSSADIEYLNELVETLPQTVEVIYGVGGGMVCDVAKYVAWKKKLPCVLIPTILSVDGFFTALVAVREAGTVNYYTTGAAQKVVIDLDVIAESPAHLRGTALIEIMTMTTALLDWKYAETRQKNPSSERFQEWATGIAASIAQQAYRIAPQIGAGKPEALRNLIDLMCMEVQLTNQLGHNRPQEGSEQYFAYAIESLVDPALGLTYAELVGPGILIAAALHGKDVTPMRDALQAAGVRLGRLRREQIITALKLFPSYAHEQELPYGILHDFNMTDSEIVAFVEKLGL